ncbi:MAG: hypothetical protein RLZ25_2232 [Pseudomonadota bacterium]|jgi:hypothetical protein
MKSVMVILLLWGFSGLAAAAGWDARTTRTNTAVTDADIQQAVSSGINTAFTEAFPIKAFGIHVLIDRHVSDRFNGEAIYLSLGLCPRLPNGDYALSVGSYTDLLFLPPNTPPDIQRKEVIKMLQVMVAGFSSGMVQNRSRFVAVPSVKKR